jgi:hypothetical protein
MIRPITCGPVTIRGRTVACLVTSMLIPACGGTTAPVSQFTAMVADDVQCRTSSDNSVVAMPGTSLAFQRQGTDTSAVVVSFVGNWTNPSADTAAGAFIFLEIDGQRRDITSTNGGVLASQGHSNTVGTGTHGFNFVTDPLLPGGHTASILWADNVLNGTGTICVAERSLVVFHD